MANPHEDVWTVQMKYSEKRFGDWEEKVEQWQRAQQWTYKKVKPWPDVNTNIRWPQNNKRYDEGRFRDISRMFYEIMGENSTVDAESVLEAIAEADELYRQRTGSYFPKAFLEEKLRELADALAWLKSDVQKGK